MITTAISWRAAFIFQALVIAVIVWPARGIKDPRPADPTRDFDIVGAILSASFVDATDVGAVAAAALLDPSSHRNKAWTITGPRAITYFEVADILTAELGRRIRYTEPGLLRYAYHARDSLRLPWGMVAVTAAIYTTARLGRAAGLSDDVQAVLGRDPIDFIEFAHRHHHAWIR